MKFKKMRTPLMESEERELMELFVIPLYLLEKLEINIT